MEKRRRRVRTQLGNRIMSQASRVGLNVTTLGEMSSVNHTSLRTLLYDLYPDTSIQTCIRIANACGCTLDDLFCDQLNHYEEN